MRSISQSAWRISSIDSSYSFLPSSVTPQCRSMRACRKYWLMAVSSLVSRVFRYSTTFGSIHAAIPASRLTGASGRSGFCSGLRLTISGSGRRDWRVTVLRRRPDDARGWSRCRCRTAPGCRRRNRRPSGGVAPRRPRPRSGVSVSPLQRQMYTATRPSRAQRQPARCMICSACGGIGIGPVRIDRLGTEAAHGLQRRVQRRIGHGRVFHVAEREDLLRLVGGEEFQEADRRRAVRRGLHQAGAGDVHMRAAVALRPGSGRSRRCGWNSAWSSGFCDAPKAAR